MKNKFLGIICILYSAIIIYTLIFDILKNFLAPNMRIYIEVSSIILIFIGLVLLFNKSSHYKFKISDLILLLPLIMIIISSDGRLSNNVATNRLTNIKVIKTDKTKTKEKEEIKEEIKEDKVIIDKDNFNIDFEVIDENYYSLADFISFPGTKYKEYENKGIKVRGFTIKESNYVPDGYFLLGKYTITCCAADAELAGFYVKLDDYEIKDDSWYEIEGVLKKIKYQGLNVMTINIINIKEIDEGSEELYVYPCYAYGDGTCKEFTKYNLKH